MERKQEIIEKIQNADAILIGASNGLSITEGLHLFANNQAFEEVFGDLKRRYGLRNILDGYFYPWKTAEERWGFLSRLIEHYSGSYQASETMQNLRKLVGEKPYFVVTSNAEGHFEMSGFDSDKVYEVEGNWIELRCSHKCHDDVYPAMEAVHKMAAQEKEGRVPFDVIPKCPKCGAVMNIYDAEPPKKEIINHWNQFLQTYHGKNLVILELGIGWRNQLIKAPLMRLTKSEPNATYITINLGEIYITEDIKEKSYGLDGYLNAILKELAEAIA